MAAHMLNTREEHEKKEPRRAKKIESITLRKSANGGLMAEHRHDNSGPGYGYHDSETHTFGADEHRKAMEHVVHHLGLKESGATSGQANKETGKS